jgi:hypothetical protein
VSGEPSTSRRLSASITPSLPPCNCRKYECEPSQYGHWLRAETSVAIISFTRRVRCPSEKCSE